MSNDNHRFAIQNLDVYIASRELMTLVVAARIRDTELRDHATRAAKSQFLNLCEGLPARTTGKRHKYFGDAQCSLHECVGGVDGAASLHAIDAEHVPRIMQLAHRVDAMLRKLMR